MADILATVVGSARTYTFTGLVNGTQYRVTVAAHNSVGNGPTASATGTPNPQNAVPGPPSAVAAVPLDRSVSLAWTPPPATFPPVSTWRIVATQGTTTTTVNVPVSSPSSTRETYILTGLTNGVQASILIYSVSTFAVSTASAVAFATPSAVTNQVPPGPPTGFTLFPRNAGFAAQWIAPANSGTLPYDSFLLQATPPAGASVYYLVDQATIAEDFESLANGQVYTISIKTHSPAGYSTAVVGTVDLTPIDETNAIAFTYPVVIGSATVPTSFSPLDTGPTGTPGPGPGGTPTALPLPNIYAFPQPVVVGSGYAQGKTPRVFRPANFGLTIEQVAEGA